MKQLLIIMLIFLSASTLLADPYTLPPRPFTVGIPEDVALAHPAKCKQLIDKLWELSNQMPATDQKYGYVILRRIVAPDQRYYVIKLTIWQIGDDVGSAKLAQYEDILSDAGVKWDKHDLLWVMNALGYE